MTAVGFNHETDEIITHMRQLGRVEARSHNGIAFVLIYNTHVFHFRVICGFRGYASGLLDHVLRHLDGPLHISAELLDQCIHGIKRLNVTQAG